MTLQEELLAYKAESRNRVPPEIRATMLQGITDVRALGVEASALKVGKIAPDFTLPGVDGAKVRLGDLLSRGPVIILFYRGAWCPYCNLQLRAFQRVLPLIESAGATLIAISPQMPDGTLTAAQKNGLEFPVLSDVGSTVARLFGVAYIVPSPVQAISRQFGNDLAIKNGRDEWLLPIPATYLITPDFRVVMAHIDADYTTRAEPQDVLAALSQFSIHDRTVSSGPD